MKNINNMIKQWAYIIESDGVTGSRIHENAVKKLSQEELADYVRTNLGNEWEDVIKSAYIKVIEKAEPGKVYETVTRDENGGEWKETKNTAKEGQFLIQNAYGSGDDRQPDDKKDPSKWLLAGDKIKKNYQVKGEVEVGQCYAPNPVPRKGIELKEPITLIASWGEEMHCKAGDWLVKAGENDIYRVEKVVFQNTYSKGTNIR